MGSFRFLDIFVLAVEALRVDLRFIRKTFLGTDSVVCLQGIFGANYTFSRKNEKRKIGQCTGPEIRGEFYLICDKWWRLN